MAWWFMRTAWIYGNAVIIDHGFGLTTLYAHLSAISHLEGKHVAAGDEIGRVGSSGLAQQPMLGFEARLDGVPLQPENWFDENWLKEHLDDPVVEIKRRLGIRVQGRWISPKIGE